MATPARDGRPLGEDVTEGSFEGWIAVRVMSLSPDARAAVLGFLHLGDPAAAVGTLDVRADGSIVLKLSTLADQVDD